MVLYDSPFIGLTWEADGTVLVMVWKRFVTGKKRQEELEVALGIIASQTARRVLVDVREVPVVSEEDELWSKTHFMPRLLELAKVHGRIYSAVVLDKPLAAMFFRTAYDQIIGQHYVVNYFRTLEEGRAWLVASPEVTPLP